VNARTYLRWMARESRGARGRMAYFAICLAVGVAAVVGTAALAASVENSFRSRSREILGADFTVDARRPLPDALDAAIAALPGAERSDTIETATMVAPGGEQASGGGSTLALLHAVKGRYPLYGDLVTEPAGGLAKWLADDTVVVADELLRDAGLEVGDALRVGGLDFRIAAAVQRGPGRFGFASFLGPRVYLSRAAFERTSLLGFGSRVRYRALIALPGDPGREDVERIMEEVEAATPGAAYLDFDSHYDAGPSGRRTVRRVESFVGLVALLSLVIGGVGVAQIVRAWLAGRAKSIAVLRCLGMRPAQILVLSLGHTALLALAGSLAGAARGCAVPWLARGVAPELFAGEAQVVVPFSAVARGLGLGVGLAVAFCLPPLTAIWRISPARVLRNDAEPLPPNRAVAAGSVAVVLLGVLGAAWVQAGSLARAAAFTGGFVALGLVLLLAARGLIALARRLPRRGLNPYVVHGISALARPGAGTTGAVVALGLGTMVVTAMWLVETRLREGMLGQIPDDAPTVFMVDIQPDQWEGMMTTLREAGATSVDQVPVVMARVAKIDGTPVEELAEAAEGEEDPRSRRWLTREQRLTWREELTDDNRIIEGRLWSDPDAAELSVEERFAERLGIGVGSKVVFDLQGIAVEFLVTSLRTVEWQSLAINFFLVAEPGALENAPALYLANARVPAEKEGALQDAVTARFPNVTVLRVRPILEQVVALLTRIAVGIRVLGSFTVLAALAILAGAVSATALRRGREVALLKTLGVTRRGVTALFLSEYGLCGAVAGLIGAGGALLLAWSYLTFVAELDVGLPVLTLPLAMLGCAALTAVCGLAASFRALRVRPIEALR